MPGYGEYKKLGFGKRFGNAFNAGFKATTNRYVGAVQFLIRHKWVGILGLAIIIGLTIWEVNNNTHRIYSGRRPEFSSSVNINLPPASSLDRTNVGGEKSG